MINPRILSMRLARRYGGGIPCPTDEVEELIKEEADEE